MPNVVASPVTTNRSHDERAAILDMLDPIVIESMSKNGGADRPSQMRPTLAPVETGAAEHSSLRDEVKIDAGVIEERPTGIS